MEELVTSRTKIQMTYICGDERHILSFKILRFWSFIKKKKVKYLALQKLVNMQSDYFDNFDQINAYLTLH